MKSPFSWAKHGQCGRYVSSALPHLARCVDDMAFLMAMSSPSNVHGPVAVPSEQRFPVAGGFRRWAPGFRMDWVPSPTTYPPSWCCLDGRGPP